MDLARSNRCFATFLQWWRDSLSGARFFILHPINFSFTQKQLPNTNNPQEGINNALKHVHGLVRRHDLAEAAHYLDAYFTSNFQLMEAQRLGQPMHHGNPLTNKRRQQALNEKLKLQREEKEALNQYQLRGMVTKMHEQLQTQKDKGISNDETLIEDPLYLAVRPSPLSASNSALWFKWKNNNCSFDACVGALLTVLAHLKRKCRFVFDSCYPTNASTRPATRSQSTLDPRIGTAKKLVELFCHWRQALASKYKLCSIIFHESGNHFYSWLLLSNQTAKDHLLPIKIQRKIGYMGTGIL